MLTLRTFATAKIGLGEAGVVALLGYCVVFVGLVLLMLVVTALGKAMVSRQKKETPAAQPESPAPARSIPQTRPQEAKGTGGQVLLHDVPEREAALVMAVVAHQLSKPLNQLRFHSIREVKNK